MKCIVCNNVCHLVQHYFYSGLAHYPRVGKSPDSEWSYYAPLYHFTINKGKDIISFCTPECATEYQSNVGDGP